LSKRVGVSPAVFFNGIAIDLLLSIMYYSAHLKKGTAMQRNKLESKSQWKQSGDFFKLLHDMSCSLNHMVTYKNDKNELTICGYSHTDNIRIIFRNKEIIKQIIETCHTLEIPVENDLIGGSILTSNNQYMIKHYLEVIDSFIPLPTDMKEQIKKILPQSLVRAPYKSQPKDVVNWYGEADFSVYCSYSRAPLNRQGNFQNLKKLHDQEEIFVGGYRNSEKIRIRFRTKNQNALKKVFDQSKLLNLPLEEVGLLNEDVVWIKTNSEKEIQQFFEIIDTVTKSYGKPPPPTPLEKVMDNVHEASQEVAIAAVSHAFTSLPDHFVELTPENERSLIQKITATMADNLIYSGAKLMINGDISLTNGLALCSSAAITKGMMLNDNKKGMAPRSYGKEDLEMIAKMAAQGYLICVMQSQLEKLSQHVSDHSDQVSAKSKWLFPLMLLLSGTFQKVRIPGIPQASSDEESTLQKVGHFVAGAGVAASVSIIPRSPLLGATGCIAGIVANTLLGSKQIAKKILIEDGVSKTRSPYLYR
jgi:hypothetical protein